MSKRRRWWAFGIAAAVSIGAVAALIGLRPIDEETLRSRALVAHATKQPDEGLAALAALAGRRPLDATERLLRAELLFRADRDDEALDELATIPDADPAGIRARLGEGQTWLRRGFLGRAERSYQRALANSPETVAAIRELIYIYAMQLRRQEIDAQFARLAGLTELTHREAWIWGMSADLIWWEPHEAEPDYARWLAAEPQNVQTRLAAAENRRRLADYDGAESLLLDLGESDPDGLAARARLELDRGRVVRAEALANRGPADHGESAAIRGQLALRGGRLAEAVAQLRIAAEVFPRRRQVLADLGRALRLAGDEPAARPILEQVTRLDRVAAALLRLESQQMTPDPGPIPPASLIELGELFEQLGQRAKARTWFLLALDADPLNPRVQGALARIQAPPGP